MVIKCYVSTVLLEMENECNSLWLEFPILVDIKGIISDRNIILAKVNCSLGEIFQMMSILRSRFFLFLLNLTMYKLSICFFQPLSLWTNKKINKNLIQMHQSGQFAAWNRNVVGCRSSVVKGKQLSTTYLFLCLSYH